MRRLLVIAGLMQVLGFVDAHNAKAQGIRDALEAVGGAAQTVVETSRDAVAQVGASSIDIASEGLLFAGDASEFAYKMHPAARMGRCLGLLPDGKLGVLPSHGACRCYHGPVLESHNTTDCHATRAGNDQETTSILSVPPRRKTEVQHRYTLAAREHASVRRDPFETGLQFFWAREYERALPAFQAATRSAPDDPNCLYLIAICQMRTGQETEADRTLDLAVRCELDESAPRLGRFFRRIAPSDLRWMDAARGKAAESQSL